MTCNEISWSSQTGFLVNFACKWVFLKCSKENSKVQGAKWYAVSPCEFEEKCIYDDEKYNVLIQWMGI